MAISRELWGCSTNSAVLFSSSFSGFGAFDRKVFFGGTGESGVFCVAWETDRSEEFEEVSSDLRPAFDVIRSSLAEAEVGVVGRDVGEYWSEPV